MTAAAFATAAGTRTPAAAERPHAALARLLDELAAVLRQVAPAAYTARPFPGISGSIGQHVRHILDHVSGLCATARSGVLSYDWRERGTDVEADAGAALRTIRHLQGALAQFDDCDGNAPIILTSVVSRGTAPVAARSTLAREILFVISHTVHHQALIALLLSTNGFGVPGTFGLAPSTPLSARF